MALVLIPVNIIEGSFIAEMPRIYIVPDISSYESKACLVFLEQFKTLYTQLYTQT